MTGLYSRAEVDKQLTTKKVFAYLSTPLPTVMTLADTWYFFSGGFDNTVLDKFFVGVGGIELTGANDDFEIEWQTAGFSDKTAEIEIAIVKNGTFVDGELTVDSELAGSIGGGQSVVSLANGFVSPHSLWGGSLETGDIIALVMRSSVAATTFSPSSASASLHKDH